MRRGWKPRPPEEGPQGWKRTSLRGDLGNPLQEGGVFNPAEKDLRDVRSFAQIHSQHEFELGLGIVAGERMPGWKDPALRLNLNRRPILTVRERLRGPSENVSCSRIRQVR